MYKYRVRGIYATAIARLLMDKGCELVDLSQQLAERLGMERRCGEAPDATIKVTRDPNRVLVVGFRDAVKHFLEHVVKEVPGVLTRFIEVGPYSTIKTRVVRREGVTCYVDTPLGEGMLQDPQCYEGEELLVHLVKVPIEGRGPVVVRRGATAVGGYAMVMKSGRPVVFYSEFIKDLERRAELHVLAQQAVREGLSVKWRSSAREASSDRLAEELRALSRRIGEIEERGRSAKPGTVVEIGESIAMLELSSIAKRFLDSVRRKVLPTAPLHHELKACGSVLSDVVDLVDAISGYAPPEAVEKGIVRFLAERIRGLGRFTIEHRKPDGELFRIGPVEVAKVELKDGSVEIVGWREVRSQGVYDGLGVAKEPGDRIETRVVWGEWFVIHRYYSRDGRLKGVYVNINTPPELCPDGTVRYVDLYVDAVYVAESGEARVIDEELLREALSKRLVSEELYRGALEKARDAVELARSLGEGGGA